MCSFKNVVGDNIFMVADVTDNGALRYLTAPFYVSSNGEVHFVYTPVRPKVQLYIR